MSQLPTIGSFPENENEKQYTSLSAPDEENTSELENIRAQVSSEAEKQLQGQPEFQDVIKHYEATLHQQLEQGGTLNEGALVALLQMFENDYNEKNNMITEVVNRVASDLIQRVRNGEEILIRQIKRVYDLCSEEGYNDADEECWDWMIEEVTKALALRFLMGSEGARQLLLEYCTNPGGNEDASEDNFRITTEASCALGDALKEKAMQGDASAREMLYALAVDERMGRADIFDSDINYLLAQESENGLTTALQELEQRSLQGAEGSTSPTYPDILNFDLSALGVLTRVLVKRVAAGKLIDLHVYTNLCSSQHATVRWMTASNLADILKAQSTKEQLPNDEILRSLLRDNDKEVPRFLAKPVAELWSAQIKLGHTIDCTPLKNLCLHADRDVQFNALLEFNTILQAQRVQKGATDMDFLEYLAFKAPYGSAAHETAQSYWCFYLGQDAINGSQEALEKLEGVIETYKAFEQESYHMYANVTRYAQKKLHEVSIPGVIRNVF